MGCSIQPKTMRAPSRSSVTGITPDSVSSRISPSCSGAASTKAEPRIGWPANGSSFEGVKMRIRAWPPSSGGSTKTVSEKFISRARFCIVSSSTSRPSVNTASWFPVSAVSVKTSATTYRRVIRASRSRTPPLRLLERSDCTLCVQDDPEAEERERDLREHREDDRLRQLATGIRQHDVEPGVRDQERGRDG